MGVGGSETHFVPDSSLVKGDKSFYMRTDSFVQWPDVPEAELRVVGCDGWWWFGPFFAR